MSENTGQKLFKWCLIFILTIYGHVWESTVLSLHINPKMERHVGRL